MNRASHLFVGIVAFVLLAANESAAVTINFDLDANNNPIVAPNLFSQTTRLTNLYAPLGVTFVGPGGNDGGAILNQSGNFGVNALSGTNFLAFNLSASMSDGGTPQGPQTILFNTPVSMVSIFGGDGNPVSFSMQGFNALNQLVASDAQASGVNSYVQLSIAGSGITRVVLDRTAGNTFWVFDDLTFTPQQAAIPEPTSLALLGMTAAGFCGVRIRRRRKDDTSQAA